MGVTMISVQQLCHDFLCETPDAIRIPNHDEPLEAYYVFNENISQLAFLEDDNENLRISVVKKIWKKILWKFLEERMYKKYRNSAVKSRKLYNYDDFKDKMRLLCNEPTKQNRFEAGRLAEKYLSQFAEYKTILVDENETEHEQYVYLRKDNQTYIPNTYQIVKITSSPDFMNIGFFGINEFYEFKFTRNETNKFKSAKEAFCQANIYAFLEFYNSNKIFRVLRKIFRYRLLVDVYVFEKNLIYSYSGKHDFSVAKEIFNFYKKKTGIDLYSLITKGIPFV